VTPISYRIQEPSALAEYVIQFVFGTLGIPVLETTDPAPDLYYGDNEDIECRLRIPQQPDDVLWTDLLEGRVTVSDIEASRPVLPFDLLSGIAAFVTDAVNADANSEDFDLHDRLTYEGSFQAASGFGETPIVNRYVGFLGDVFQAFLDTERQPLWPEGMRCAVALSHDVDAPIKHGASGGPWVDSHASITRNLITNLYRAKHGIEKLFGSTGLEHWHFPFIMDAESMRGFKSSFMFAVTRRFDRTGHPDYDVSYDAGAARFRDLYRQLTTRDFETGLHAGYLAYEQPSRFEEERSKLEQLSEMPVRGVRHHVWHTGKDVEAALEAHESAGFEYDSSLAFNRHAILRRSVALPYRPWVARLQRAVDVIQIPVALMDGHLFYQRFNENEALERGKTVIDMIRDAGGVGAIDWHVRTSNPDSKVFAAWGRTYLGLLDYLSELDDVWVTNLAEISDWTRARERRIGGEI
jgi:hypothetical protein